MYTFEWDDSEIRRNIAELDIKTKHAISAIFDYQAARSTTTLKTTAPWHDNTSAARNGLHAEAHHLTESWELILAHAVSYGIYLEVCNSGRYQVILPVLRMAINELQQAIDGLWGRLR